MPTLAEIGAGVGGFAKRARDAISPWNMFSGTDVASFLPGGGMVQASQEQFPAALKAYRAGDYGTAAREGLAGTLGTLGDVAWAAGPVIGATAGTALKAGSRAAAPEKVVNTLADLGKPGITAYHGSPHSFDKFDMSKIGTGEGAQAYGHGLYFAENEKVAKGYRDALKSKAIDPQLHRDVARESGAMMSAAKMMRDDGHNEADTLAILRSAYKGKPDEHYKAAWDAASPGSMYEVRINADPEHFLDWDKPLAQQSEAVQAALKQKYPQYFEERVINPFSRMPVEFKPGDDVQKMRDFLVNDQKYPVENSANTMKAATFVKRQNFDPAAMSQELNQAGIPGVKYLDAGSRTALQTDDLARLAADLDRKIRNAEREIASMPANFAADHRGYIDALKAERSALQRKLEPSRNYVVFDDKLVEILRKYGWVPGAAIPTAAMYEYQKAQQQPQQAAGPQM